MRKSLGFCFSVTGVIFVLGANNALGEKSHYRMSQPISESLILPEVDLYRGDKRLRFAKKGEFFIIRECPRNKEIKTINDCDPKTEVLIRQDIFKEKLEYELLMSQVRRRKAENKEFNAEELALVGRNLSQEINEKQETLKNYKEQLSSLESIENPSADRQEEILKQKELVLKTENELAELEKIKKPWRKLRDKLATYDKEDIEASQSHYRSLERAIIDSDVEKTFEFNRGSVAEIYQNGTGISEKSRTEKIFAKVLADMHEMPAVPCGNDQGNLRETIAACANRLGERAIRNVKINGVIKTWKLARIDLKGNQFWYDESGGVVWREPTARFRASDDSFQDCLSLPKFRISDTDQAQKGIESGIEKAMPKIFPGEALWVSQKPLESDQNKQFSFGKYSMFVGGSDGGKVGIFETRGGVNDKALIRLRHLCARNMVLNESW